MKKRYAISCASVDDGEPGLQNKGPLTRVITDETRGVAGQSLSLGNTASIMGALREGSYLLAQWTLSTSAGSSSSSRALQQELKSINLSWEKLKSCLTSPTIS